VERITGYLKTLSRDRREDACFVAVLASAAKTKSTGNSSRLYATSHAAIGMVSSRLPDTLANSVPATLGLEDLWVYCLKALREFGTANLWLENAVDFVTATGFWQKLESTEIRICDYAGKLCPVSGGVSNDAWSGLVLTADPPTVITCKIGRCKSVLRILDIRNHLDLVGPTLAIPCCGRKGNTCGNCSNACENCSCPCHECMRLASYVSDLHRCLSVHGLGRAQATVAGQSMRAFRESSLRHVISVHDNWQALELERSACHPGRNEVYYTNEIKSTIYELDASSHYLAAARESMVAARLAGWRNDGIGGVCDAISRGYSCIARCEISTGQARFPCRFKGGTCYPLGRFAEVLAGCELESAIRLGFVTKVHDYSYYECEPIFTEWVDKIWKARQEEAETGNKIMASYLKRLGVTLFGKFAQSGRRWITDRSAMSPSCYASWVAPSPDLYDGNDTGCFGGIEPWQREKYSRLTWTEWRSIGWCCQWQQVLPEGPQSMPAIAAFIYALGREKLWEWLQICGIENTYYCDTDSVFCNREGYERLVDAGRVIPGELGFLRLKGTHNGGQFFGLKQYRIGSTVRAAGCPANAEYLGGKQYSYSTAATVDSCIGRGVTPDRSKVRVTRRLTSSYRLGNIQADGRVTPFTFGEGSLDGFRYQNPAACG
jgi:DNA polymerase type B, organellar and viral